MTKKTSLYELAILNKNNNKNLVKLLQGTNEFKVISFRKNEIVSNYIRKNTVFFIIEGHVLQSFLDVDGQNKLLDILNKEEFLGVPSLENGVPAMSEYVALTNVKVLAIPVVVFLAYPEETLPVLYSNYQYVFSVLYLNWRASLAPGSERVNTALISLVYYVGKREQFQSPSLPAFITHQLIADFASVSRSYVTRCLSKLTTVGIINMSPTGIVITNMEELKKITPSYQPF